VHINAHGYKLLTMLSHANKNIILY